jgi:hypothetical protein
LTERILCWFSCGVASAVATKLAIEANAKRPEPLPLVVARCWVAEEDEDNDRFADDCARWFGVPILPLMSKQYAGSIYNVFKHRRFISGPKGAPCTLELKKAVREAYQQPDDIHVFGYCADERKRWDSFLDANNGIQTWDVLGERNLTHDDCQAIVARAGIKLPDQYLRGFEHNNCKACVKATSPDYWKMVRFHHPHAFNKLAEACKPGALTTNGARLARVKDVRIFLHELPEGDFDPANQGTVQCGIFCEMAESELSSNDIHGER